MKKRTRTNTAHLMQYKNAAYCHQLFTSYMTNSSDATREAYLQAHFAYLQVYGEDWTLSC